MKKDVIRLTLTEYVEDCKRILGYPVVDIALTDDDIKYQVNAAFREVRRYITETRFVTVPYSRGTINTVGCNINTVVQVFRTRNPSRVGNFTDIYSLSTLNVSNATSTNLLLSDYLYRTQMNQLKSTITTDLDFTYDKEHDKLYISTFYPQPVDVTIAYIPEFSDVSEVKEQYWINYINRMAQAFTKIAEGRVRSKYELSSSLYKLDGTSLIQEGISERDTIRQELDDNSDIVFPID